MPDEIGISTTWLVPLAARFHEIRTKMHLKIGELGESKVDMLNKYRHPGPSPFCKGGLRGIFLM